MPSLTRIPRLTDAQRAVAARCFPLVDWAVRSHAGRRLRLAPFARERAYDKAVDALLRMAVKFDPGRGIRPETPVAKSVASGAAQGVFLERRRMRLPAGRPASYSADGWAGPGLRQPHPADTMADAERDEAIRAAVAGLDPREARVVADRYGLGGGRPMGFPAIGKGLRVSKTRATQLHDRAISKLYDMILLSNLG